MAIAFGAAGTRLVVATSSTTWNVAYPSGISAGDLLVIHISSSSNISSTLPSGWDLIYKDTTTTSTRISLIYTIATGSESGTVAVTMASSTGCAQMARFSGVDQADPLDSVTATSYANSSTGGTAVLPSLTPNTANGMLVFASAHNSTSTTLSGPAGSTERWDFVQDGGGGTGYRAGALYTEPLTTATATGTRTITLSSNRTAAAGMFVLKEDQGGPAPLLSTLVSRIVGISTTPTTTAKVTVKTTSCSSARLICATDSGLTTGVVNGSAATPDADGYATLSVSGLTPNTRYYYRVEMTDGNGTVGNDTMSTIGRIKTAPSGAANFAFDFGSCENSTDPIVFPLITARGDDMFFHLGDMFYNDGSGTTLSNIKSKLEGKITLTNHADLFSTVNMTYTPSDHDVAQNDSNNGSDPTAWGNWRTAADQLFPDIDRYYTWVWGRVRFIKLDTKNFASDSSLTDNSSKTLLGTTQKQWFKDTIDAATEPAIVIVQPDVWIGSAIAGDNGWFGFTTERTELANYMVASGKNFIMVAGDMHAIAADNGTNSAGGITVFQAAPFGQTASQKGGPYTTGPFPASGTAFTTQYGRVVVTDGGGPITFAFTGYDSTNATVASLTKTFTLPTTVNLSGSGTLTATAVAGFSRSGSFSGSGTLTSTRTPGASQTASLSGSGTLSSTRTMTASASGSLSGSGTLSSSVTVAFSKSAGLTGSGTLAGANVTPAITVTPSFSGSGTLGADQNAVTLARTVNLSGTGTLSRAVVANFAAGMSASSEGTLTTATSGVGTQASAFFTSTGTLAGSGFVPTITKTVSLTGSGTLTATATKAVSVGVNLSGDGNLTTSSSNSFNRSVSLSGVGTLVGAVTNVTLSASAALSSVGTLSSGTVNNKSTSANLSGSGALLTQNTGVGFTTGGGLSGSGTLTGSSTKNFTATGSFSGLGQLSGTVVVHKTTSLPRDGFGDLAGNATRVTMAVSVDFSGVGTFVADPGEAQNYLFDSYLGDQRWEGALASKRWEGDLL